MWMILALALMLALSHPAAAQTQSFFLHHSDTPVPIPGGTTTSFLDALAPAATPPVAEEQIIASGNSASFSTFTTAPFASDSTVSPIASVRLHFAANAKMKACGAFTTQLFKVDTGGGLTPIGAGTVTATNVAQGSSGGTVGAGSHLVEFPISDTSVLTGEGIALATSFTNGCNISRRVFFAYDGKPVPSRVRFQCCLSVAAKCAETKLKTVATLASCLLGAYAQAASHDGVLEPERLEKCEIKMTSAFAKTDGKGGCLILGDGPDRAIDSAAFAATLGTALNPSTHESKCQNAKLKSAGKTAKCLLALEAKAAAVGQFLEPDPTKAQKCRDKLTIGFAKLEGKLGNDCDTTGDAATVLSTIGAFETQVTSALACPCP
jgi:hypothetical protein